ncbi:MAG: hypothetical protein COS99_03815 [Candidatus Omnitrophica bacterium CG07_land_8_20_14_0_80_42_15]|uniref:DUF2065 domain-containing protein n=1 Tax=Candidatus Aquitaenariimonas noxiae TaxID=1974741 RepID=A0A2J0L5E8_9BACT|nr:MAG: hypothetical protein COS99_03815 [Candidatus Omnitrophica bacterium CG07_land_8_20_14_0_80_42_15]
METAVFIAKILGPCYLIIAIGIMLNREFYQKVMEDFSKNAALVYIGGLLALVIGLLIVLSHNVWVANWTVIITIFGWGGLIKGTWLIAFPNTVSKFMHAYQTNKTLLMIHSAVVLVLGLALTIFGYFIG